MNARTGDKLAKTQEDPELLNYASFMTSERRGSIEDSLLLAGEHSINQGGTKGKSLCILIECA